MNSPSAIADSFVQAYYVDTDIQAARSYCEDLACVTLAKELALREGQRIGRDTQRPHITAKRLEVFEESGGARRFLYAIQVKPAGMESFQRKAFVKVRPHNDAWKVTQFGEIKAALPRGPSSF